MRLRVASGAGAAERWRKQYERSDGWGTTVSGSAKDVYDRIIALGPTPTPEAVAGVIGNEGWSFVRCSGCSQYVKLVVEYGEDDFALCRVCLIAGSAAVEAVARFSAEIPR